MKKAIAFLRNESEITEDIVVFEGVILGFPQNVDRLNIGLHGQNWLDSIVFFQDVVQKLLHFSSHKLPDYLKGMRAVSLIQSTS